LIRVIRRDHGANANVPRGALLVIPPANKELLDPTFDPGSGKATALLAR
jgi:hypothetical protein